MFKSIDEALEWVMGLRNSDASFEYFKDVMNELGNPQNDFYTIHVAGTNGKGSTVNYLRDLLMSQGYSVGTMQSPHYLTHLDRIRINDVNIEEEAFLRLANKYHDFIIEKKLNMFQADYIIMCDYFKEKNVDMAVVEVGLGGRLDSTNVVDNTRLSIITTIGYDHMELLGNTLEEITREKCGIIKDNSKVLVGDLGDGLKDIVRDIAERHNSEYYELKEYTDLGNREFVYDDEKYAITSYAKYQIHNASLAIEAFHIVSNDYPFAIDTDKAKDALRKSLWKGRFEVVKENPRVILDGAHNTHGINALVKSFDELEGSKAIIFSALKRKEFSKMISILRKHSDKLVITTFPYYQAINLNEIDEEGIVKEENYRKAIDEAIAEYDNVLICGSLYFLSEVAENYRF